MQRVTKDTSIVEDFKGNLFFTLARAVTMKRKKPSALIIVMETCGLAWKEHNNTETTFNIAPPHVVLLNTDVKIREMLESASSRKRRRQLTGGLNKIIALVQPWRRAAKKEVQIQTKGDDNA